MGTAMTTTVVGRWGPGDRFCLPSSIKTFLPRSDLRRSSPPRDADLEDDELGFKTKVMKTGKVT